MNNLSLQTMQVATQKSSSESVSKGDAGAGGIDSGVTKDSFQTTLNKQVQANESQSKSEQEGEQPSTKNVLENKAPAKQRASDQLSANLQAQVKARVGGHAINDAKLMLDDSGSVQRAITVEGLIQKTPSVSDGGDAKVDKSLVVSVDVNSGIVDASAVAPMLLGVFKNTQTQVNSNLDDSLSKELTREKSLGMSSGKDAQVIQSMEKSLGISGKDTQNTQSVEKSLGISGKDTQNTQSMEKSLGISGKDTQNTQSVEKSLGESTGSDATRGLDSILSSMARQSGIDESAVSKLLLSTTKDSARESVLREVVMPANYQAVLPANTPLTAQEVGSANIISSYPGKSGWDQAISQKVVWMVGAGEQSATLTLNPPDLGPLQVVIHVHNDQADTTFISGNKEVRQALEDGMSNLRDKMSDAGIQLGQANVSSGNQSQQEFQRATRNRSAPASNFSGSLEPQVLGVSGTETQVRTSNGLVDIFA